MTKKGKKKKLSGHAGKSQLEAWQPSEKRETITSQMSSRDRSNTSSPQNDQIINDGLDSGCNGWDVNEMFRKNKEMFGVTSSYSPDLEGYTTPLIKRNTKEYKEKEAEATRIASEILRSPVSQTRNEADNRDEEDLHAFAKFPEKQNKENGTPSYHSQYDNNFSPGKHSLKIENHRIKSPARSKVNTQNNEILRSNSKGNNQNSKRDSVSISNKHNTTKKNGITKHITEKLNKMSENNNDVGFSSEVKLSQISESVNKSHKKVFPTSKNSSYFKDNVFKEDNHNKNKENKGLLKKLNKEEKIELIYTNGAARQEVDETLSSISSDDSFLTENSESQAGFESPVRPKQNCCEDEDIIQLKILAQDELDNQISQCIEFMSRVQDKTVEVETEESWHESLARQLSQDREQLQVVVRQSLVNKRSMEAAARDIRLAETRLETESACEDAQGLVEAMQKWERDQYAKISEILEDGTSVLLRVQQNGIATIKALHTDNYPLCPTITTINLKNDIFRTSETPCPTPQPPPPPYTPLSSPPPYSPLITSPPETPTPTPCPEPTLYDTTSYIDHTPYLYPNTPCLDPNGYPAFAPAYHPCATMVPAAFIDPASGMIPVSFISSEAFPYPSSGAPNTMQGPQVMQPAPFIIPTPVYALTPTPYFIPTLVTPVPYLTPIPVSEPAPYQQCPTNCYHHVTVSQHSNFSQHSNVYQHYNFSQYTVNTPQSPTPPPFTTLEPLPLLQICDTTSPKT